MTKLNNSISVEFSYWLLRVGDWPSFTLSGVYSSVTGTIECTVFFTDINTIVATGSFNRGTHTFSRCHTQGNLTLI